MPLLFTFLNGVQLPCHINRLVFGIEWMVQTGRATVIPKPDVPCHICGEMMRQYDIIYHNKN